MKHAVKICIAGSFFALTAFSQQKADSHLSELSPGVHSSLVEVVPAPYGKALRNPLKGFTTRGIYDHEWATLAHTYIAWNQLENHESDGVDKIRRVTEKAWSGIASRNIKVIPRVYLHYATDEQKYWPIDMTPDDYTSEQFQKRVVRLIERLGSLWDTDPRVAFIELGIFGKWGEHHSPAPTQEMQQLVSEACAKAFKNKLVSVRHNWNSFQSYPFGEYWDSWAHLDQVWGHGNNIAKLNDTEDRYLKNYIGGETAYDWGNSDIQPGPNPTESVAKENHRNFVINTLRWLHCTQLRWIENYDTTNAEARTGADLIQKAFGYRYIIEKVVFSPSIKKNKLHLAIFVKNMGSAPFYYDWPLEVSLLDPDDRSVVWKQTFDETDIRDWLPGDGWTDPEWSPTSEWPKFYPNKNWVEGTPGWSTPPKTYTASGDFKVTIPPGRYILALAILDPAGQVPSLRFATSQYFKGGRHPIGVVAVDQGNGGPLPEHMVFDDPAKDKSLHYLPQYLK